MRPFVQGEVSEWLKEHAWKVCIWETVSRVRIPLSPQKTENVQPKKAGIFVFRSMQSSLCHANENKNESERSEWTFSVC